MRHIVNPWSNWRWEKEHYYSGSQVSPDVNVGFRAAL